MNLLLKAIFLVLIYPYVSSMIGGIRAPATKYKFMVAIHHKNMIENKSLTSGIILNAHYILTSCSKLSLYKKTDYIVVAGDFSYPLITHNVQTRIITHFYCHIKSLGYVTNYEHDLALAYVIRPFVEDLYIGKAYIRPNDPPWDKSVCVFIGAGASSADDYQQTFYFHEATVEVHRNTSDCTSETDKWTNSQMCSIVNKETNKGRLCKGDDSGALFCDDFVEGLAVRRHYWTKKHGEDGCNFFHPDQYVVFYHKIGYYTIFNSTTDYPSDEFYESECDFNRSRKVHFNSYIITWVTIHSLMTISCQ